MSNEARSNHAQLRVNPWAARSIALAVILLPVLVLFKRVPAEIAVGLTVSVALFVAVRRQDFSWLAQGWLYAAAALSLVLLVLATFSLDPGYSALSAVLAFRWPIFAAALIWLFVEQPRNLRYFEWSMLAVIIFILFDTIWQYVWGVDLFGHLPESPTRLTGPFNHMLVGTFTARVWFIGLAVVWFAALRFREAWALLAVAGMSAIGALLLFLTGERAALLAFLLGSVVVVAGIILHYPRWRWRLTGLIIAMMILVAGVAATQKEMVNRSVDSTIHTITHLDETVYGLNLLTGLAEFQARPLTGVGARQFMEFCDTQLPTYREQYVHLGFNGAVLHPHNFYTGMLAEGGIFAFLALVAMVWLLFARLLRDAQQNGVVMHAYFGSALLLVTFWPVQSSMEYFNGWTAAVIWTGVAWALARGRVRY